MVVVALVVAVVVVRAKHVKEHPESGLIRTGKDIFPVLSCVDIVENLTQALRKNSVNQLFLYWLHMLPIVDMYSYVTLYPIVGTFLEDA